MPRTNSSIGRNENSKIEFPNLKIQNVGRSGDHHIFFETNGGG